MSGFAFRPPDPEAVRSVDNIPLKESIWQDLQKKASEHDLSIGQAVAQCIESCYYGSALVADILPPSAGPRRRRRGKAA